MSTGGIRSFGRDLIDVYTFRGLRVSGDVVVFDLTVRLAGSAELPPRLEEALRDPALDEAIRSRADDYVQSSLGPAYRIEPIVADGARVRAYLAAVEGHRPRRLARSAGAVLLLLRRELREQLVQRLGTTTVSVDGSWAEGPALLPSGDVVVSAEATDAEVELQRRINGLRRRLSRLSGQRTLALVLVLLLAAAGLAVGLLGEEPGPYSTDPGPWTLAAAIWITAIMPLFLLLQSVTVVRYTDAQIQGLESELELGRIATEDRERRAQKLFQVHSIELKRYYDQALRQGGYIFYVGVFCIILGFGTIGAAFAVVTTDTVPNLSEKIVIAALSAVAGMLANFIAVIYLRMFSETVKAVTGFHQRLVITHHLHFGNFLAAKIEDPERREKTLAEIAAALSARAPDDDWRASAGDASAAMQR